MIKVGHLPYHIVMIDVKFRVSENLDVVCLDDIKYDVCDYMCMRSFIDLIKYIFKYND